MSEHDVPDGVEFVQHEPCDNCGSSDAAARYSDDHLYCFSCHHYTPRNAIRKTMKSQPSRWRTRPSRAASSLEGEVQALPARGIAEQTCQRFGYGR